MMEIPLFLPDTVLYPGGRLELRVFETHYMDMIKERLRTGSPFGVCLIGRGGESAAGRDETVLPDRVGTLANIVDWDMPQFGILNVVTHGGVRFRVLDRRTMPDGLVRATVETLPEPPATPIPGDYARLVPMLRGLIEALEDAPPKPYRFYDAAWVAARWAEILPLPPELRQRVLETDDGIARLDAIYRFLEEN